MDILALALTHIVAVALGQKRLHTDEIVSFCNVLLAVIQICDPYRGSESICPNFSQKPEIRGRFHCHNMGNSADYASQRRCCLQSENFLNLFGKALLVGLFSESPFVLLLLPRLKMGLAYRSNRFLE
jgi:hypothetical protein